MLVCTPGAAHLAWTETTAPPRVQKRSTMEVRIPDMEFLTERDNRVWGCSSRENAVL